MTAAVEDHLSGAISTLDRPDQRTRAILLSEKFWSVKTNGRRNCCDRRPSLREPVLRHRGSQRHRGPDVGHELAPEPWLDAVQRCERSTAVRIEHER